MLNKYVKLAISLCFFPSMILVAAPRELVILHTNDMHARVIGVTADDTMCTLEERDSPKCFGGFDRIYSAVNRERSQHKNTVVVDAGDQFSGTMFHQIYLGKASGKMMNQIGFLGMAVGNHEFDDGPKVLGEFASTINFPLLSANIDASKDPNLNGKIKPYIIKNINGIRVGLVGYTTEDTAYLSSPGALVKFLPIVPALKHAVAEIKKAGVDVIIALSHSGLARDMEVAKQVDGIAAIICGHSNSLLSNNVKNADGPSPLVVRSPNNSPVLLASAYAYGKFLGKLTFTFDRDGKPLTWAGEPILLDGSIAREPSMSAEIAKLYEPIAALSRESVGHLPVDIDGGSCRFQECVFGNVIADAMLLQTKNVGAKIAMMNGGGIRASLSRGPVSSAQLKDVLPFDKTLVLVKLSGATIRRVLEHGVAFSDDKKNDNTGRFLQVAGMSYRFDSRKPRGKRIVDVKTNDGEMLDDKKIYEVVTNSYMVEGGDNFNFFKQSPERWSIALELKDLFADYIQTSMAQLPKLDGRIKNVADELPPSQIKTVN